MKIIVLGDIHGRTCWKEIIEKENPDKVIFMGDYVSSHDNIPAYQQISNLEDIMKYKEAHNDDVIMLRGNHDCQHLEKGFESCCFEPEVWIYMQDEKERFLKNTQWVYIYNDIIFTHAGISQKFWNNCCLGDPTNEHILMINNYPVNPSLFGFTPDSPFDYYGNSSCQPCTWIRPEALLSSHLEGRIQVVGHTRMKYPGELLKYISKADKEKFNFTIPELWCVDALPDAYMVMNDDERMMKILNQ